MNQPRFIQLLALAEARAIDRRDWAKRTRIYRIRRKLGYIYY